MTKTQMKSALIKMLEKLGEARDEVEELRSEAEETRDSIEPYDGKDELTEAQEQRQEWFDDLEYILSDLVSDIEESANELECKMDE